MWPSDSTFAYLFKETQDGDPDKQTHPALTAVSVTGAETWKPRAAPTDGQMEKMQCTTEHCSAAVRTTSHHLQQQGADLEAILLRDITKPERDQCRMVSVIGGL